MRSLFFILLSVFLINNSYAGINNTNSKKWVEINKYFLIDTKSFNIEPPLMFFWVKNQNYAKRRLTINCSTFEERERYQQLKTEWAPIFRNTPKYKILNQLCFLTDDRNFSKERRPPEWASNIIRSHQRRLDEDSETLKENDLNDLSDLKENKKPIFIE
jgi:hypothetical protein